MNEKDRKPRQVMRRPKVCPGCKQPFGEATEKFESTAFKIKAIVHFKDKDGKELKKTISTPILCNKCIEKVVNDEILAHCSFEKYAERCLRTITKFNSEHPEMKGESE